MAKGQLRSNKETKKPKKDKTKVPAATSPFATTPMKPGGTVADKKK